MEFSVSFYIEPLLDCTHEMWNYQDFAYQNYCGKNQKSYDACFNKKQQSHYSQQQRLKSVCFDEGTNVSFHYNYGCGC